MCIVHIYSTLAVVVIELRSVSLSVCLSVCLSVNALMTEALDAQT